MKSIIILMNGFAILQAIENLQHTPPIFTIRNSYAQVKDKSIVSLINLTSEVVDNSTVGQCRYLATGPDHQVSRYSSRLLCPEDMLLFVTPTLVLGQRKTFSCIVYSRFNKS